MIFFRFKTFILLSIILSVNSFLLSQSDIRKIETDIGQILAEPFFEQTTAAINIFDLTDNIFLYQHNHKLLLHPASNMKILTSLAGLLNLGEYYTFRTDLFYSGVIKDDTLYGDIFVVGGFDPDFTTMDLDSLVGTIKALGIKYVTGGLCADISRKDSLYWGEGWMWDDDPSPYAPHLSALNINDNAIEVFIEGSKFDSPANVTLIPETKFVTVENNSVTVSANKKDNFLITRDWVNGENKIIISGEIRNTSPVDSSDYTEKLNLLHPEKYFLTLFAEHLENNGIYSAKEITVSRLPKEAVYINSFYRSIDTVLTDLNKESDNLNAEMIVYAIAYEDSGAPAEAGDGLAAICRLIDSLGLKSDDYMIADGSGLSHYNLVTAELLVEALKYIYYKRRDLFSLFYKTLPVAGIDGTLKNRMKGTAAENNVHAKTGTLRGVSNLSGYVTAKNGHLITFSILIQNFKDRYSEARKFQDKICELLAGYE